MAVVRLTAAGASSDDPQAAEPADRRGHREFVEFLSAVSGGSRGSGRLHVITSPLLREILATSDISLAA